MDMNKQSWRVGVSIMTMCIVAAAAFALPSPGRANPAHEASAPLKFMSFNIWGDYFGNPVYEREAGVEATILKDRPDVVSLQEVTPNWYASPMFATSRRRATLSCAATRTPR